MGFTDFAWINYSFNPGAIDIALTAVAMFLWILSSLLYWRLYFQDPGYVAVKKDEDVVVVEEEEEEGSALEAPEMRLEGKRTVCAACQTEIRLRTRHCNSCDRCVDKFGKYILLSPFL